MREMENKREMEAAGIAVIHPEVRVVGATGIPIIFKNDGHWNAYGHRQFGDKLTLMLKDQVELAGPSRSTAVGVASD